MVDIPTVPLSDAEDEDSFSVMRLASLVSHHRLLLSKLQALEAGLIPNLMVLMPPGSAKSSYCDVVFAPWFMAKRPRRNVILASYASDIAAKQGRRARQLIGSRSFGNLMETGLHPDKKAADEWMLLNGSEFMSGGLLSGLTGNRAHLGIVDDPIRGREAAESQVIRNKTWDAYVDDFCSRLIPGAPQVMILTRWHEDDPAGRILPEKWDGESGMFDGRDGRKWEVLCLPAIADRADDPLGRKIGETLWPEWFSHAHWAPFQRNVRTWTSLYQQKPTAPEGTFFQRKWFKRYQPDEKPKYLHVYMSSDHATSDDSGDWTVIRVWGVDSVGDLWMLGGYRLQGTTDKSMGVEVNEKTNKIQLKGEGALALVKKWKPFCWFPENDNTWKAAAPFVTMAMRSTKTFARIEPLTTAGGDKAVKAGSFQAMAAMGKVHIPVGPEFDAVIEEYVAFPGGKHDDEVDAAAHMGRALDMAHPAIVPVADAKKSKSAWDRAFADDEASSWKVT